MGMSINEAKQLLSQYQKLFNSLNGDYRLSQVQASELSHSIGTVLDNMRRYQMIELDRKSDMASMLEEIQSEIKELWDSRYDVWLDNQYYIGKSDTLGEVDEVIQQKIDALKGEQA